MNKNLPFRQEYIAEFPPSFEKLLKLLTDKEYDSGYYRVDKQIKKAFCSCQQQFITNNTNSRDRDNFKRHILSKHKLQKLALNHKLKVSIGSKVVTLKTPFESISSAETNINQTEKTADEYKLEILKLSKKLKSQTKLTQAKTLRITPYRNKLEFLKSKISDETESLKIIGSVQNHIPLPLNEYINLKKLEDRLEPAGKGWILDTAKRFYMNQYQAKAVTENVKSFIVGNYIANSYNTSHTVKLAKTLGVCRTTTMQLLAKRASYIPVAGTKSSNGFKEDLIDRLKVLMMAQIPNDGQLKIFLKCDGCNLRPSLSFDSMTGLIGFHDEEGDLLTILNGLSEENILKMFDAPDETTDSIIKTKIKSKSHVFLLMFVNGNNWRHYPLCLGGDIQDPNIKKNRYRQQLEIILAAIESVGLDLVGVALDCEKGQQLVYRDLSVFVINDNIHVFKAICRVGARSPESDNA